MKILFFSYAYPNPINPSLGTFNRTMIAGLAAQHEVQVVSPVPFAEVWKSHLTRQLPRGLNDPNFQAVPGVKTQYCTWYYTPKLLRTHYGEFMRRSVGKALHRTLDSFRPDIVLSYWTHPDGEVAVKAAHQHGVKAVAMVGGSDVLINGRSGARRDSILNVLRAADGVVTVSEDIRRVLMLDGIPPEKLFTSRRGIDRQMYHDGDVDASRRKLGIPCDRPMLLSVGRLVDVKGHKYLIEACRLLVKRGIQFRCDIVGGGPLRQAIEQQIDQYGLADVVTLHGSQSSAQLAEWYRAADLSVLTSLSEGVPNVLLESIASGTPFVASNVGGIPEIADETFDRLVPAADPVALADAIAEQLPRLQSLPCRSRSFEPQTVSQAADSFSALLRSIHSGRQPRNDLSRSRHDSDLDSSIKTTTGLSAKPQSRETAHPSINPSDVGDEGARTGEYDQLSQAIQDQSGNDTRQVSDAHDLGHSGETASRASAHVAPRQPPRYDDNAETLRSSDGLLHTP